MAALCEMISAGLIEKDNNGDVLWTWAYPFVTKEQREMFCKKCCLKQGQEKSITEFIYSSFQNLWYYIFTTDGNETVLKQISHFSLVIVAKDFNPEKYEALCRILSKLYKKSGSPAAMLESYLSVVTKGVCNGEENGAFALTNFDNKQAYVASSIKDVIGRFQIEVILIYTALLLKKRIAVYHSVVEELLNLVRILPALVWHRQNWSVLHPFINLNETELQDLKKDSYYVAGFTEPEIENRSDLYDLFINASAGEISVATHAKETFAMGKLHKDLAMHMLESAQDESKTEQQVVKDVAIKTKELINNLQSLADQDEDGNKFITIETLKQRKMQPATENFLFSLACAEGMVKT